MAVLYFNVPWIFKIWRPIQSAATGGCDRVSLGSQPAKSEDSQMPLRYFQTLLRYSRMHSQMPQMSPDASRYSTAKIPQEQE